MKLRTIGQVLLVLLPAALPLRGLAAQSDPRLQAAIRLSQDGMSDSARAVAGRILAATQPTDSLYPEALYTMGLLAATEQDRRLYLKRVVLDYLQSPWADDALLHLVQLDYSSGNAETAMREVEQLLRDYPDSPLTAQAAFWGARAAGDRREAAIACRMVDAGLAAVGDDIELRNQLEFQKQRCQGLTAIVAESVRKAVADSTARAQADSIAAAAAAAKAARTPARSTRPAPVAAGQAKSGFYVQTSAVKTDAAAEKELSRIKGAGYSAVATREGEYLKIRAGAFKTRGEAAAAAAELAKKLGGRPFVVRVP